MNVQEIIDKYYPQQDELKRIYMTHARKVADFALEMAARHPELSLDLAFVEEAALLHDLGIFLTDAPRIYSFILYKKFIFTAPFYHYIVDLTV